MNKLILLSLTAIIATGCTSTKISQRLSSGSIGCHPNNVRITNETATIGGVHNFTAQCKGKTYQCNYVYPGPVQCSEVE